MQAPTLHDVIQARGRIEGYITRTPLHRYIGLEKLIGAAEVHIKHENHQRLGAFKMRGGINLLSQLSADELERGVATASSGNHGQSIAYAASVFGSKAYVAVPMNANPGKVASMRNLGAEVIHHGEYFDESREYIERLSREEGYRYVHAVNEPNLIAGVGTYSLEILEDLPDVDVDSRPCWRGQRRERSVHRRQVDQPGHTGNRSSGRAGAGSVPVVEGRLRRRGSNEVRCRGPRHWDRV